MSKANDSQVGGTHYKDLAEQTGAPQHWDMMWALYGEAWFVGCITKYVLRYRRKNGVEDLKKAKHYLEKLIELEAAREEAARPKPSGIVAEGTLLGTIVGRNESGVYVPVGPMATSAAPGADPNVKFETCCECGDQYPQVDLHEAGHVFCVKCRKRASKLWGGLGE